MLDRFCLFLPMVQGDLEALEEMARRFVGRQAAQNVLYTEVRYSPHILTSAATYNPEDVTEGAPSAVVDEAGAVVDAVTRGLRRGCAEHPGTEVAQILCFIDNQPGWAPSLSRIAAERFDRHGLEDGSVPLSLCPIVGVDIAAGEGHFSDADGQAQNGSDGNGKVHRTAMCRCAGLGLGLTNHAGEAGPAANVAAASSAVYGGARRIGHGYVRALSAAWCAISSACLHIDARDSPSPRSTAPPPASNSPHVHVHVHSTVLCYAAFPQVCGGCRGDVGIERSARGGGAEHRTERAGHPSGHLFGMLPVVVSSHWWMAGR